VKDNNYKIHYDNFSTIYDTWVTPDRIRALNAADLKKIEDQKNGLVIEKEKYKAFMTDCAFAVDAVGQLCYYLDEHPSEAPGFHPDKLRETLQTLEKLDKLIKEKYPLAISASTVNRTRDYYSNQPGVYREVAEQRIDLAKKALADVLHSEMTNALRDFDTEFKNLKSSDMNKTRATMWCNTYVEWAYWPEYYSAYKNSIKKKFDKAYSNAGIEFSEKDVFEKQDKQLDQVKKYIGENISSYPLATKKGRCSLVDKEAEAVVLKSFKAYYPGATVVHFGCMGDYIVAKDKSYVPPRTTGEGKTGIVIARVPGISYLVSYNVGIEKRFAGGKFGPVYLFGNGNPFTFDGLVNGN
jgi:hypothetical protein